MPFLFLHPLPFLISNFLGLLFGTWGGWSLFVQTGSRGCRGSFIPGWVPQGLVGFRPSVLQSHRTLCWHSPRIYPTGFWLSTFVFNFLLKHNGRETNLLLSNLDLPAVLTHAAAATAAKSLQSCPTLCDPIDGSPPGPAIPGSLQARTLEWVAISSSNAWKWKVKVKSLSCVRDWTTWLNIKHLWIIPSPLTEQ